MDLASTDHRDDRVARLLQLQALLGELWVLAGHLDETGVAEEVGRVEQVDVQTVALDPFAAVDQPAQLADRAAVDRHAARVLHRSQRAHLVGDRADPADPRRDVGRLALTAASQERLEESRRLVDPQLDVAHLVTVEPDVHRTLALDPGEVVGADRPSHAHVPRSPPGIGRAALKVRYTRTRSRSSSPLHAFSDAVFGVSFGP